MEQDIIEKLFTENSFEATTAIPWIKKLTYQLIDYYSGTNLANNIFDIMFTDEVSINAEDGEVGITYYAVGDDGEYEKYVYITASVSNDFETLSNFDYDVETGDAIDTDDEEEDEDE